MAPSKKPRITSPALGHANRWLAESLRTTLFFSAVRPHILDMWEQIVGAPPETVMERPAQGVRQSVGPFGSGVLTINQSPARVDFVYAPKDLDENEVLSSPFVDIGPFSEATSLFSQKIIPVLSKYNDCVRIAYSPVQLITDASIKNSNAILASFLKDFSFDVENDRDISVQINKPKTMVGADDILINRIFKWNAAELQLIQIGIAGQMASSLPSASMCRLDLDLSTDARNSIPIAANKLEKIYSSLESEAQSIILEGNV